MDLDIEVNVTVKKSVRYLRAECGVRYWEDATVNGAEDAEGDLIPCRKGDAWCPIIDLETGKIENWPEGTTAKIHYKVCDDGRYALLDRDGDDVKSIDGYVITMMCPEGEGFGDYVIMNVGPDGKIENWKVDFSEFEK